MADRIIELPDNAADKIRKAGFEWYVDGDNDDYLTNEAIEVSKEEVDYFAKVAEECHDLFMEALQFVSKNDLWLKLGLPDEMVKLIKHDLKRNIPHVCGRMDLAGGIDNIPVKLIEYNADTCTIMPESAYFQSWMYEPVQQEYKGQYNYLIKELTDTFRQLKDQFPDKIPTLLLTSLGHDDDRLNLRIINDAATAAGFLVDYANLDEVIFSEDGVFLENEKDGDYDEYFFVYKLVPWEFIIYKEPELMSILSDLCIKKDLIVLNPSYSLAFQAKHMLSILHEMHPDHPNILPAYESKGLLYGKQYVVKANFGRMGENIQIYNDYGDEIASTGGFFDDVSKVYQEFAEMYSDEEGDIYQGSMYLCGGVASCLSFRRRDSLIIDDDSEFVSHVLF